MFAGLTSRCTRPTACAASSAEATGETIDATRSGDSGPSRRSSDRTSPPCTKRIAINSTCPTSPASYTGMMCGSSTAAAARDSRMKRCRNMSSEPIAGVMIFNATSRFRRSSRARKTTAIPPAPTCSSSRYPPSSEPVAKPAARSARCPGDSSFTHASTRSCAQGILCFPRSQRQSVITLIFRRIGGRHPLPCDVSPVRGTGVIAGRTTGRGPPYLPRLRGRGRRVRREGGRR